MGSTVVLTPVSLELNSYFDFPPTPNPPSETSDRGRQRSMDDGRHRTIDDNWARGRPVDNSRLRSMDDCSNIFDTNFGNFNATSGLTDQKEMGNLYMNPSYMANMPVFPTQQVELSPPQSAGLVFPSYAQPSEHEAQLQPDSMHITSTDSPQTQYDQSLQLHPSLHNIRERPPTPKIQTYTSPYSDPNPSVANLPAPLKPRRRGPKPKAANSKTKEEEVEQHRKFLERNKQAAKRCRERKKINIESTQSRLKFAQKEIVGLMRSRDLLTLQLQNVKMQLKNAMETCTCERRNELSNVLVTPDVEDGKMDFHSWSLQQEDVDAYSGDSKGVDDEVLA